MAISRLSLAAIGLLGVVLVLSSVTLLPVGLSTVVSDSMAPTLEEGDAFVRVPAGSVEAGEMVVFETRDKQQRFAVHRVVEQTAEGYVTKGDNNPVSDQAANEPPVRGTDIHGQVLTVGGTPAVIPGVGGIAGFVRSYRGLLLVGLGGLLLLEGVTPAPERPSRPPTAGEAIDGLAIVAVVAVVTVMVFSGVYTQVGFLAVTGSATGPGEVSTLEPTRNPVTVDGAVRQPWTHYAVNWDGGDVVDRRWTEGNLEVSVAMPAAETTGPYATYASAHRYPATLPTGAIDRLYAIHPTAAALGTTLPVIGPLYMFGRLVINRRARLRESTSGWARRWKRFRT